MQVKKSHLEVLVNALVATEGVLTFTESRIRDSFLKKLSEPAKEYLDARNTLLIKLGTKVEGEENRYKFTPEYFKEAEILDAELVEITVDPKIKEFLEKTTYKPKVGEADLIDDIIKLF